MFKRIVVVGAVAFLTAGLLTSCILDPKESPKKKKLPGGSVYKDLTQPDHVLENLELAYNERNLAEYDRLLDDNFTFFFSDADFGSGRTPEQWNRQSELTSASHMFDPNFIPSDPLVGRLLSIDLNLVYPAGTWTEIQSGDPQAPDEKWYIKTVTYNMTIKAEPSWTFLSQGLQAQFTVRQADVGGKTIWRIVEWYDDSGK